MTGQMFDAAMLLARAGAVCSVPVLAFGFLWFSGTLSPLTQAYVGITSVSLLVFGLLPRRHLRAWRGLFMLLGVGAILISIPQMVADLRQRNGPDVSAFVLRLAICAPFAAMVVEGSAAGRRDDSASRPSAGAGT